MKEYNETLQQILNGENYMYETHILSNAMLGFLEWHQMQMVLL